MRFMIDYLFSAKKKTLKRKVHRFIDIFNRTLRKLNSISDEKYNCVHKTVNRAKMTDKV
jgi:hypothetical protein